VKLHDSTFADNLSHMKIFYRNRLKILEDKIKSLEDELAKYKPTQAEKGPAPSSFTLKGNRLAASAYTLAEKEMLANFANEDEEEKAKNIGLRLRIR